MNRLSIFLTRDNYKHFRIGLSLIVLLGSTSCSLLPAYGSLVASRGASGVLDRFGAAVRQRDADALLDLFSRRCLVNCYGFRFAPEKTIGPLQPLRWTHRAQAGSLANDLYGQLRLFSRVDRVRIHFDSLRFDGRRRARARVTLAVDGRLQDGSRRADRGTLRLGLRQQADDTWQIDGFALGEMRTVLAHAPILRAARTTAPLPGTARAFAPKDLTRPGADRGPGLAVADVDGDGDLDVFLPGPGYGRLLRNDGAAGLHAEAPVIAAGAGAPLGERAIFGDLDGDGDPDLFVVAARGDSALLENQKGRFKPVASQGLDRLGPGTAAAFLDADGDGRLDLLFASGRPGHSALRLYRRTGARFQAQPVGTAAVGHPTAALCTGDLDGDGRTDVVLVPQRGPLQVLQNRGGTFSRVDDVAPVVLGRACSVADVDGDGALDVVVAGVYSAEGWKMEQSGFPLPQLYSKRSAALRARYRRLVRGSFWLRNDGGLRFTRRTLGTPASLGWDVAVAAEDLDGDGRAEVLLAGGFHPLKKTGRALDDVFFTHVLPRQLGGRKWPQIAASRGRLGATRGATLFTSRGADLVDIGDPAGLDLPPGVRAAAWADLDRDGRPDLLVRTHTGALQRYTWRQPLGTGRVLTLRLAAPQRDVSGARVSAQGLENHAAAGLDGGASDRPWGEVRLGLGTAVRADRIRIHWPDGTAQTLQDLDTSAAYTVFQGAADPRRGLARGAAPPLGPARKTVAPPPRPARPGTVAGLPLDRFGSWQVHVVASRPNKPAALRSFFGKEGTVLYLPPARCPACKTYLVTLARAARSWARKGLKAQVLVLGGPGIRVRSPLVRLAPVSAPGLTASPIGRLLVLGPGGQVRTVFLGQQPDPALLRHHLGAPNP